MSPTEATLRAILAQRIMILDGAMGTIIQQYKLDEEAYRGGPAGRFIDFAAPADSGARELFVKATIELLTLTQPTHHPGNPRALPGGRRGPDRNEYLRRHDDRAKTITTWPTWPMK